ncbi:restriction endonuclease [Shouchella miscanthi]|uniref:Topoisomerase DNA-binding C4 zinc finger domain-containing protein n=1 Tax=Shouchella miscanthi TaxID=2598861 RepID=A0ABU6NP01_9BACI|nr:restriction endonuclease [Shouchella miscanthi]MED4128507.1 topoisomerase DNA-binding C4 zinc finger domain-containing protein [Shouchella miscanthi]
MYVNIVVILTCKMAAKRYNFRNRVGIEAVQQVYASKAYYKAQEAWVITNSYYTLNAKNLAKACGVKLLDRVELQEFINKVNPEVTAADVYYGVEPEVRSCPECGNEMKVRTGRGGASKFFGCASFPHCRHTEQING